jgi:hypothetical protein
MGRQVLYATLCHLLQLAFHRFLAFCIGIMSLLYVANINYWQHLDADAGSTYHVSLAVFIQMLIIAHSQGWLSYSFCYCYWGQSWM